MALRPLITNRNPIGIFDCLDGYTTSFKGGEVVTLTSVANANSTDKAAYDVFDGYTLPSSVQKRPAVTRALASGKRPLFLADEGIAGYGTLLGSVVGGTVGQVSVGGTVLGPHTAEGSGKVTCWSDAGLYAVSLDAVDTTSGTGLVLNNTSLDTGSALYATATGLLTPNSALSFEASLVVGRFVEFATNGSLVTTPNSLVNALNSPSGAVATQRSFQYAVFQFNPNV